MFHKEGHKIILISFILTVISFLLIDNFITETDWLRTILMLLILVFLILILQFFRNPKRLTSKNDHHIVSPVDGKVVVIEEVYEKEYLKKQCIQLSVFMSPINVHVTRYPTSGDITFSKYHPGKYLVAWHPKASEENERTTVVVKNKIFENDYNNVCKSLVFSNNINNITNNIFDKLNLKPYNYCTFHLRTSDLCENTLFKDSYNNYEEKWV